MRKTVLRVGVLATLGLLVLAATALAIRLQVGNVIVTTDGGFTPTTLPKDHFAPIKIYGHGRISTADGQPAPVLEQIILWFDKHGSVETRGLPACTAAKLANTKTAQARQLCPGAIVGKGKGTAIVYFPESAPIPASSPLTLFNGPPKHGNPTVLAHAHLTVPVPTTFVVSIEIQRVHDGRFGFKTVAKIPRIAGGYGVPTYGQLTIGREWTYKGKRLSYVNAGCPDGRLQAKGRFIFKDGTVLAGGLLKRCTGKG